MYLGFERIEAAGVVLTTAALTVPGGATGAEIVTDTQDVRYTMDDVTDPAQASGMIFKVADEPKQFGIDDINRIRFMRGNANSGFLNIHYFGGRAI